MKRITLTIFGFVVASLAYGQPVFNALAGPTGGNIIQIERTSSNKLFVLTTRSLYESTNSGNDWIKNAAIETLAPDYSNEGLTSLYIDNADKIYVATKSKIYKSNDAGVTWTSVTGTGVYNPSRRLLKNETTGSLYVLGYNGSFHGIQRSMDDGLTWFDVSPIAGQINELSIKNTGSFSHLYASTSSVSDPIYKSTDDAGSWSLTNSVSPSGTLPNAVGNITSPGITVSKFNGRIYLALYAAGGLYVSNNDGTNWVNVAAPVSLGENFSTYGIFASQTGNRVFLKYNSSLYYSDNATGASATWTLASTNNTDNPNALLAYSSNVFAGLYNDFRNADGILRSTNSGVNWSYADKGITEYETSSFVRADNGNLIVINGGSTIMMSTDDGATWTKSKQNCTCGLISLVKKANGNIVAIGDRTFQTVNNGSSWTEIGGPHADFISRVISGDGGTTLYGIGGIGGVKIYRSTNGGTSFSELAITGVSGSPEFTTLSATNTNNLFAITGNNKAFRFPGPGNTSGSEITNSGISFFRDIDAVGANVYIAGDKTGGGSGLAKSTDQGTNWTMQAIDEISQISMVSDKVIFSVNFNNEVSFSNDAGVEWNVAYQTQVSGLNLNTAVIDANGIAYVSTVQDAMRKSSASVVAPNKPTNLKTIGVADKIVHLEWDNVTTGGAFVDTYIIERKLTSGGNFSVVGEADGSEFYYRDGTTVKNTSYDYRVIADSDAGSVASDPITVVTKDDCPLAIPDNRSWDGVVTPGSVATSAPVSIRKVSSDYYEISEFTAGTLNGVAQLGGGTYNNTNVSSVFNDACGTPFIEENDDVYPNGNGTWNGSNTLTLKFQINKGQYTDTEKVITLTLRASDPAPEVPSNLSAQVVSDNQIQLQWLAGDFQKTYIIERSLTSTTGFSQVGTADYPTLTFSDPGPFTAGTTYFYRIKAQNGNTPTPLESAYTAEVSLVFNKPLFVLSSTMVSATQASVPTLTWADLDNDGFEDLLMAKLNFAPQGTEEPLFFKNNGEGNFDIVTGKFPTALNFAGPTVADFNNDGNLDVFISGFGIDGAGSTTRNYLLRNNGDLTFTDLDASPVTAIPIGQSAITASWIDVNSNGFIDLFIPYEDSDGQKLFAGSSAGTFSENTSAGALIDDSFSKGTAMWADYDNDGDMDAFVLSGDDGAPNRLYQNTEGIFTRITPSAFDGDLGNFFTASWGDYDNDQFLDIFVGDQEGPNLLYRNNGNGTFTKVSQAANSPTENLVVNSTGSAWGDVDNDGDIDLVVSSAGERNLFYINQGNGTFTKKTNELISGFNTLFNLGTAFADYDNDGHLDVVIGALNFPVGGESGVLGDAPNIRLYKNNVTTGNWIKIKLSGAGGSQAAVSNRAAIGSRIKIVAGGKTQIREITSLTGTGAQSSLLAHFGLASETTITSIEVRFPSGNTKTLTNVNANQLLVIDEDAEGPTVATFTPANQDKGFGQYDITLGANDAVAVSSMTLRARPIGGTTFSSQPMGKVSGTNNWQISVTESNYDDMGMEFFFEAADPFGNTTRSPATGNYYSYLNYKETNAPKFPTSSLVFGGTDRTWNIVSIPFDLGSSATVTSVLDELGSFDDTQWRLLTYQNQTDWGEFPTNFSSFTRGKGYFLNVKTPPSAGITIADPILAPQNNQSDLFTIGLNQGWNQIGNPYLVPIKWSDVKAFNSTVSGVGDLKLYDSNGRTYVDGDAMAVYQGGFVFANETVQDYAISFAGQAPGGRKKNAAGRKYSTELDSERWRTMFTLKQSDVEFKLGGIGMSPDAKVSYDDNDDVTLPRLADFLEVNFHHPEHFAKRFSRDIVPTQNEYTWEFTVDSNLGGIASLEWDNEVFGLNDRDLFLLDVAQQKLIDMREVNSYSFDSDNANKFKVYYGSNLNGRIQPEKILLGQAWPNPARDVTTIPFTLPASNEMFQVRLEVYDMMGRRVSVLHEGQLPSGFYESLWNTSSGQWTNGIYTYRLAVAGAGKSEVFSNKIILNK